MKRKAGLRKDDENRFADHFPTASETSSNADFRDAWQGSKMPQGVIEEPQRLRSSMRDLGAVDVQGVENFFLDSLSDSLDLRKPSFFGRFPQARQIANPVLVMQNAKTPCVELWETQELKKPRGIPLFKFTQPGKGTRTGELFKDLRQTRADSGKDPGIPPFEKVLDDVIRSSADGPGSSPICPGPKLVCAVQLQKLAQSVERIGEFQISSKRGYFPLRMRRLAFLILLEKTLRMFQHTELAALDEPAFTQMYCRIDKVMQLLANQAVE